MNLSVLNLLVIADVHGLEKDSYLVSIKTECGKQFDFYHEQDCCECVRLEDYEVGTDNFAGAVILSAEEVSNTPDYAGDESGTWTFYKIETTKGEIFMRWLGESNGYYSESVTFRQVK